MPSGFETDSRSGTAADWSREHKGMFQWAPDRSLLAAIRSHQRWSQRGLIGTFPRMIATLRHRFWSAVTGADIPVNCRIGGGLMIPHPNGIVVHPDSSIGVNCLLFQQVTLGGDGWGVPTVGNNVDIGAGAKVIGQIHIGDHARIGANAVVTIEVPPHATAVGIPARIVGTDPA